MLTNDAAATVDRLLAAGNNWSLDIESSIELAEAALAAGREADVLPLISLAANRHQTAASLWQWKGLLHRAINEHGNAIAAFDHAVTLQPDDSLIQHSLARTTLEAGLPATNAYDRALHLAPRDGAILLGRTAALLAGNEPQRALDDIDIVLTKNPGWISGHETAARLRWMTGQQQTFLKSLNWALVSHPRDPALWRTMIQLLMQAEQYEDVLDTISRARVKIGEQNFLFAQRAAANSELGRITEADADYALLNGYEDESFIIQYIRHMLRAGRPQDAARWAERQIVNDAANLVWPYLGIAWRLLNDSRYEWYEGNPALIATYDLDASARSMEDLTDVLHSLHNTVHQPLDQTLRGGTQTDGNLFQRLEQPIRNLRAAVINAVQDYLHKLGPLIASHPTLCHRRDQAVRIGGAWSVRLAASGFHIYHTHPAGWLSSAFYVLLPKSVAQAEQKDGWLVLGLPPPELAPRLHAIRVIQPKVGRLVLFPSTMWHCTNPFTDGERMTVAFDVALPKLGNLV